MKPMMNNEFHTYERSNLPTSVLITGGAGFIGSHLSEVLLEQGYRVTIIDNLSTGRFENIAHLTGHPNFRFAIDSITNEIVMDRLVSECSLIFHLAAAVGVKLIVERPVYTIENNVMGTEVVLKTALRYRAKVLIASTSEVYGKGNQIPFCEDDDVVLGPTFRSRWGYAASKMVDEFFALAYHREFGLPVVIFRLFNTVGPRQTGQYGMVIPRFVQTGLRGEPLEVYGDGLQSRCFLHVQDAVAAMVSLAKRPQAVGQVFNVGAVEEITIVDLAKRVLRLIDSGSRSGLPPVAAQPSRPRSSQASLTDESMSRIVLVPYEQAYAAGFDDMRRRVPDLSKVKQYTGWEPKKSLDEILLDVIESIRPQVQVG